LVALTADSLRLKQIPLNLLSTACKFTKAGEVALRVPFSISPKVSRQKNCLVAAQADVMLLRHSVIVVMESVAMSEHRADTPEQVLKFVPKEWPNSYGSQVEEVGQAIVTKIQRAADLSNENCDRALALAHKLSIQLRTAEDRISQLEAEVELFRDRAARAERWLQTIQNEIEEKLIAPRSAITAEQTPLPKDAEL
jgi:hypothetical protein